MKISYVIIHGLLSIYMSSPCFINNEFTLVLKLHINMSLVLLAKLA